MKAITDRYRRYVPGLLLAAYVLSYLDRQILAREPLKTYCAQ